MGVFERVKLVDTWVESRGRAGQVPGAESGGSGQPQPEWGALLRHLVCCGSSFNPPYSSQQTALLGLARPPGLCSSYSLCLPTFLSENRSPPFKAQLKDVFAHCPMALSVCECPCHSSGPGIAGRRGPAARKEAWFHFTHGAAGSIEFAESGSELSRMPSFSQAGSRSHHTVLQSAGSGFLLSICFLRKAVLKSPATGILRSLPGESRSPPLPL